MRDSIQQLIAEVASNIRHASKKSEAKDLIIDDSFTMAGFSIKKYAFMLGCARFPLAVAHWCMAFADGNETRAKLTALAILQKWTTTYQDKPLSVDTVKTWLPGQLSEKEWTKVEEECGKNVEHFLKKIRSSDFTVSTKHLNVAF